MVYFVKLHLYWLYNVTNFTVPSQKILCSEFLCLNQRHFISITLSWMCHVFFIFGRPQRTTSILRNQLHHLFYQDNVKVTVFLIFQLTFIQDSQMLLFKQVQTTVTQFWTWLDVLSCCKSLQRAPTQQSYDFIKEYSWRFGFKLQGWFKISSFHQWWYFLRNNCKGEDYFDRKINKVWITLPSCFVSVYAMEPIVLHRSTEIWSFYSMYCTTSSHCWFLMYNNFFTGRGHMSGIVVEFSMYLGIPRSFRVHAQFLE